MFGDFRSCRSRHKCRCRRNIEGMRLVAARAAGIDQIGQVTHVHSGRKLAHHLRGGGDLRYRLRLHVKAHQNRRDLYRRDLAFHHLPKQVHHFVVKNFTLVGKAIDRFLRSKHGHTFTFRKFFNSA